MIKNIGAVVFCCSVLAACATPATNYTPLVDYNNAPEGRTFHTDLQDCREIAQQVSVNNNAAGGAVAGALFGAVIGGIIGHATGDTGAGAAYGAALSGTSGAATGAGTAIARQTSVINNCMTGRGWSVL